MRSSIDPILLVLTTLLPGCGGAPPGQDPGRTGRFTASVSTGSEREISGFAVSDGKAGVGWSMTFTTPGGGEGMLWITEGAGRPEPGTYKIVDAIASDMSPPAGEYVATVNMEGTDYDLQSVSGTLTITESSASAVSGRFSFSGRRGTADQTGTVEGTFTTTNRDR
ncbi:MAG: hypothetical protein AB7R55_23365 [Gemmatimonadales bacterium]